jgi:hypothetical protein
MTGGTVRRKIRLGELCEERGMIERGLGSYGERNTNKRAMKSWIGRAIGGEIYCRIGEIRHEI